MKKIFVGIFIVIIAFVYMSFMKKDIITNKPVQNCTKSAEDIVGPLYECRKDSLPKECRNDILDGLFIKNIE